MTRRKTFNEYYKQCKERKYDLPLKGQEYKNWKTKLWFRCNRCGKKYLQEANSHLMGRGCYSCGRVKTLSFTTKTNDNYLKECKEKGLDMPIEPYINNSTKITYICNRCGNTYKQTPRNHLYFGCPICKESHGERLIRNYLDKNNIKYESQKKFKDLKDKTYLSYDFYLPKYKILIEYQGKQHYEKIRMMGSHTYTNFKKQQYHDYLKADYANKHGYKLVEISYKYNTQKLVDNQLNSVMASILNHV